VGRDSVVSIGGGGGAVQICPGTHPATYTVGTGSFPGAIWPGCVINHPTLSCAKKEEYSYTCTPPVCLCGMLQGELYFFTCRVFSSLIYLL
jgi:hypothetical protein